MKNLLFLSILLISFMACDPMKSVYAEIDVVSDVDSELHFYSSTTDGGIEIFYLTGDNSTAFVTTPTYDLFATESFNYNLTFYHLGTNGCADIELRIYKDGNLKTTRNVAMGCVSGADEFGNDCNDYCGTSGNVITGEI